MRIVGYSQCICDPIQCKKDRSCQSYEWKCGKAELLIKRWSWLRCYLSKETARITGCSVESVYVVMEDVKKENWGAGGQLCSDKYPELKKDVIYVLPHNNNMVSKVSA